MKDMFKGVFKALFLIYIAIPLVVLALIGIVIAIYTIGTEKVMHFLDDVFIFGMFCLFIYFIFQIFKNIFVLIKNFCVKIWRK